jgi:hypothetical protein
LEQINAINDQILKIKQETEKNKATIKPRGNRDLPSDQNSANAYQGSLIVDARHAQKILPTQLI